MEQPVHSAATRRIVEAYDQPTATAWPFVMLAREPVRRILRAIVTGKRAGNTLVVWLATPPRAGRPAETRLWGGRAAPRGAAGRAGGPGGETADHDRFVPVVAP